MMTQPRLRQRHDTTRAPGRSLRSVVLRVKVRLQWTGWLQYLPTAVVAVVFLAVSAVGALIGTWRIPLFWLPFGIGALLLAVAAFDVITVRMGLRPREPMPRRRDDLDGFDLIHSRRSCRSFQRRDLTGADREELMRAIREHTRPDHLIGTSPIRLEYVAAPLTAWPAVGVHEFIVAIAPRDYDRLAIIDVGRSLHKVVLHATRMGVATCWIGPGADQTGIVTHLDGRFDPGEDHVVCVCALGYRSHFKPLTVRAIERMQHRRLPLTSLFFADSRLHAAAGGRRPSVLLVRTLLRGLPVVALDPQQPDHTVRRGDGRGRTDGDALRLLRRHGIAVLRPGGAGHLVRDLGDRLRRARRQGTLPGPEPR